MERQVITRSRPAVRPGGGQLADAISKGRYQIGIGIALAVCLPLLVRNMVWATAMDGAGQSNTAMGAAVAIILSYISYRKIHILPGISSGSYIITSFTIWFSILMFFLSMFRMEYSTVQFATSYTISVAYFLFIHLFVVSRRSVVLGFVPGAATARLPDIGRVKWHRIASPESLLPSLSGVVVDLGSDHSDAWSSRIAAFALEGVPVYHVSDVIENLTGMVEIRHLSENTLGSLNPNDVYFLVRRVTDALLSGMFLLMLVPVFLLVGVAIKLDSPGPMFFKQARVGFRNRIFTVYKFRTMISPRTPLTDRHAEITQKNDPRITTVGRVLRKFRIDEMPQLINVIKGDMGLIGPRPEAVSLSKWYEAEIPFYHYRHIIKPGITGWAQVSQGHVSDITDVSQKLHLDFYYVKNFSFWLDVLIVLKTIRVIVRGIGAK